jgi:hypothetical protein
VPKFILIPGTQRSKPQHKSKPTPSASRHKPTEQLELLMQDLSVFEYVYRDGANYKAWGTIMLRGRATEVDRQVIKNKFESGEYFIAEQLGIPALYEELWKFSDGPTEDDHVWHTFFELREFRGEDMGKKVFGTLEDLVSKINAIQEWDLELSPHWDA